MQIIEYFDSDRQDHWLNQIKKSDGEQDSIFMNYCLRIILKR